MNDAPAPRFAGTVRKVQAGDVASYAELVTSFQDMAVGYAYSILGDFHLAEDAAQEAFFDAYRHLGDLREPLAFPSWLRRIVFKHCDRRTRRKSIPTVPFDELTTESSESPSPSDIVERNEMRDRLEAALEKLPEKQRSALVLHYMSGHAIAELAAFLEVPAGTVKKRLHDGRERLREILVTEVEDRLRGKRPSRDTSFAEGVVSFLRAARAGNADRVKALLLQDPRLREGRDFMGNTALIIAVATGHLELAKLLREAAPPIGYHEAAAIGDTARVATLLDENGELVDALSNEGFTAFGLAAHYGHMETARYLIERGADVNAVFTHPIGSTPLIGALFGRQVKTALLAIEHGAEVDRRRTGSGARAGWSALHYAAAFGLVEVVSALLERGAERAACDAQGKTPLDVAREQGQSGAERLLLEAERVRQT